MSLIRTIGSLTAATFLLCSTQSLAQEVDHKKHQRTHAIMLKLEASVVPFTKALNAVLVATLPAQDAKRYPLGMNVKPTEPGAPLSIVYTCVWGDEICEPFFKACTALLLNCSDGG